MKISYLPPIAFLCLAGCAGGDGYYDTEPPENAAGELAVLSTGQVSCSEDEMGIIDDGYAVDGVSREWTVDCYGVRYYCESYPVSPDTSRTACHLDGWPN